MQIVSGNDHLPILRELLLEYAASLGFDLCVQGFDEEVATLPARYAPPDGALLLALVDGVPAGCLAMRRHDAETCELKRLWMRPVHRRQGFARQLVETMLELARGAGYRTALLDTHSTMTAAVALYRSLGFAETAPFSANPHADVIYLQRELNV
jgi:putative acetyltransferase